MVQIVSVCHKYTYILSQGALTSDAQAAFELNHIKLHNMKQNISVRKVFKILRKEIFLFCCFSLGGVTK